MQFNALLEHIYVWDYYTYSARYQYIAHGRLYLHVGWGWKVSCVKFESLVGGVHVHIEYIKIYKIANWLTDRLNYLLEARSIQFDLNAKL